MQKKVKVMNPRNSPQNFFPALGAAFLLPLPSFLAVICFQSLWTALQFLELQSWLPQCVHFGSSSVTQHGCTDDCPQCVGQ